MKILLGTILTIFSVILQANEEKYFKSNEDRMAFYLKAKANFYNFRVEGTVVDQTGELLSDVKVSIKKTKDSMNKPISTTQEIIKNGIFDYSTSGSYGWHLLFEKQGYYSAGTGFTLAALADMIDSKEATLDGLTIVKRVRIVLYSWGEINRSLVRTRHHVLSYSEDGDIKKLTAIPIPYLNKENNIRKDEEFQFSYKHEYTLPKNLIYIVPGRNKDGSNDGTIRLKTNIPKSGFIRLAYGGDHFFRRMWEAPETGYQPELILKEDFGNSRSSAPYIVFYFKVKDIYGKGLIMPKMPESILESDKASLKIYLYMNKEKNIRNTNAWIGTNW